MPRNPYRRTSLFGVDLVSTTQHACEIRAANLAVEPIPFPDDHFASVSAYDFLEHVPRLLPRTDGHGTRFPFVEVMDEIWRVLEDRGRLWALTPAFPHAEAFVDPTHVNIISAGTHAYFCGDAPLARMYGFGGRFEALQVRWVERNEALLADLPPGPWPKRIARRLKRLSRWLRGRGERRSGYLLWELEARKRPGTAGREVNAPSAASVRATTSPHD